MLTFNVPRTDESGPQHPVETRPKATIAWLDRLPYASPADTAQQLLTALHALNRLPLSEDERYTLLALYHPVIARTAASLENLLAESGVPPLGQHRQSSMLLRDLLTEHSIGYKHVLLALDKRRFGRPTRRIAEVTSRLLSALQDIQTACYLTYNEPPDGLWLEMHQLYQSAKVAGSADNAADDALPASLVYRQSLLLALADPPHMSRAELNHTRMSLEKFAALATLSPAVTNTPPCGFVILTDIDRGPSQLPVDPKEGSLWLDTEALCRHLHETATRLQKGESSLSIGLPRGMESEPSLNLSKRLLKAWRPGAQRAFKRYASSGSSVQLVAGVSAIHRLLELLTQTAHFNTDAHDNLHISDVGLVFTPPAAVTPTRWTIINDSAAGLALSAAPDAPLNLKVGDALALRDDEAAAWSLAVIRWIRMRHTRQVELGVERLSPQMQSVWVRILHGARKMNPEPALFVPGLPALKQPDRLLLPRPLYRSGMDAEVRHPLQQPYTLTFGRRLEHTPSFDLIDFTLFSSEP